jgi:hypothetical protein
MRSSILVGVVAAAALLVVPPSPFGPSDPLRFFLGPFEIPALGLHEASVDGATARDMGLSRNPGALGPEGLVRLHALARGIDAAWAQVLADERENDSIAILVLRYHSPDESRSATLAWARPCAEGRSTVASDGALIVSVTRKDGQVDASGVDQRFLERVPQEQVVCVRSAGFTSVRAPDDPPPASPAPEPLAPP